MTSPGEPMDDDPVTGDLESPGTTGDAAPSATPAPSAPDATAAQERRRRPGIRATLARIPHPPMHSRRGWMLVLVLVGGLGAATTVAGAAAVQWTETADFCGRCHTMGPELQAHAMSPHRELACAECHVEPGVGGWIKAKLNGTRQLLLVLTNTFETPIAPPDHADLPPTSMTCVRCHDPETLANEGGPIRLVLKDRFHTDAENTKDSVALVLRPSGFGGASTTRGVHWHVVEDVEYLSSDPRAQTIDYVTINESNGEVEEFIASSQVTNSNDVQPDIDRLMADETLRRMDCIDCHNRVGHGAPTPGQAVDDSMSNGTIDPDLPYIKREATARLSGEYDTVDEADRAIEGIRTFYATRYPLNADRIAPKVNAAIDDLKRIYRLVATPEMRVTGTTYPNNIGHETAPGCFRCHDGAHYKVVDGALSNQSIPSNCATCHTFPQIGATTSGVLIGDRPTTHDDRLWVFSHKAEVASLDPAGTSCGACHTRTYCDNCHDTEAVNVPHDDMVYNHAAVMDETGPQSCAYCHQPVYCAQCHSDEVLPDPFPSSGDTSSGSP